MAQLRVQVLRNEDPALLGVRYEPLYKRSLAIRETSLGSDHPDVAITLNVLAGLYQAQGRYAEAEPLYKRSLAIREKALGPDHPDVGHFAQQPGRAVSGPGPLRRGRAALQAQPGHPREALGPAHRDGTSLNNLAELYQDQGRYAEAEPLYKRSLAIYNRRRERWKAHMTQEQKVIKAKVGLLELAKQLGSVSQA